MPLRAFAFDMNLIQQSYLSVTDFEFYRTVARQPWRRSAQYFFFWVAVAALFTTTAFSIRFYPRAVRVGDWLVQNLPPMDVRQGKLSAEVPVPYRIAMDDLDLRIVVDPSDSVRQGSSRGGIEIIFNSDRIHFQFQGREDAYVFKETDNFRIDRESLGNTRAMLQTFFVPLSLILLFPYYALARGVQALFLSGCGLLLRRSEPNLRWSHWLNIAVYAQTPAILIGMIFQATTVPAPVAWFFYITTALLYTLLAGRRCSTGPLDPPGSSLQ
ncbi:MAG: DUF1189 family protein [Acidobacteria bacterium]|nr:DUF1189 family protein [Acidobacteriota bacterium]